MISSSALLNVPAYYIFADEENNNNAEPKASYESLAAKGYAALQNKALNVGSLNDDLLASFASIKYPFPPPTTSSLPLLVSWRMNFLLDHLMCTPGSELFRLLLEARPHRSKWFDPSRLGQAELYDALERVLLELKAFHPHSLPFLQRVSKKAVPDYYQVIHQPMDLGTMSKKLRNKLYTSKQDFMQDLNLIHENCFLYNTDQESQLRRSVVLLREKWTLLMQRVPEITIQPIYCLPGEPDELDNLLDEQLGQISDAENDDPPLSVLSSEQPSPPDPNCKVIYTRNKLMMESAYDLMRQMNQNLAPEADFLFLCNSVPDVQRILPTSSKSNQGQKHQYEKVKSYLDAINLQLQIFHGTQLGEITLPERTFNPWTLERYVALELLLLGFDSTQRHCLKILTHVLQHIITTVLIKLRRSIDRNPRKPVHAYLHWLRIINWDERGGGGGGDEKEGGLEMIKNTCNILDERLNRWHNLSLLLNTWREEALTINADSRFSPNHSLYHSKQAFETPEIDTLSDVEIDEEEYLIIPKSSSPPIVSTPDLLDTELGENSDEDMNDDDGVMEPVTESNSSLSSTTIALKRSRIS